MTDKQKLTRFLVLDLNHLAYGAASGLAGGVIAGIFARLAMRAVAILAGIPPEFSVGGTVAILVIFGIAGSLFGLIYAGLARYLPLPLVGGGWLYGAMLMGLAAIPLFRAELEGELAILPPQTILAVFAPVFLSYGGVLGLAARTLKPRLKAATPRPTGILSLAIFSAVLVLGLMSIPSLGEFSLPFPRAIAQAYQAIGLTYQGTHSLNSLLATGFSLAYAGAAIVIYWLSGRSRMAKFSAIALLAFAAAFFNSRDVLTAALSGYRQAPILSGLLRAAGYSAFLLLLYLFPDGRFQPRWTLPLAILFPIWGTAWLLDLGQNILLSPASWPHRWQLAVFFGSLGTGVLAQISRYRGSVQAETAPRGVLVSFSLAIGMGTLVWLLTLVNPELRAIGSPRLPLTTVFAFAPYIAPWILIPLSIAYTSIKNRQRPGDVSSPA